MQVGSIVEMVRPFKSKQTSKEIMVGVKRPIVGGIYTVRNIVDDGSGIGLQLEEIVNPPLRYSTAFGEAAWHYTLFRELLPPMDMSFVEEMQLQKERI